MATNLQASTDQSIPRGIRNNNPGNIKDDGTPWKGQVGNDGVFVTFDDMSWGTRALGTAVSNMIKRGLNTITALISTWAPPEENDTDSYINSVATDTGIPPTQILTPDAPTLSALMRAIINHENGDVQSVTYVTDQDIADGLGKMNSPVATLAQSAVVAAEVNPGQALLVLVAGVGIMAYLFRE